MAISYRFGTCEVKPVERKLLVDGRPAELGGRAFDLLLALLERHDRVVSKHELLDAVWPGLVVEENNLQVHVSALRKQLGREAIATVPGRGYRFAVELAETVARGPAASHSKADPQSMLDSFVGREGELTDLGQLMATSRLVTILGPGGVGKTRLAYEATKSGHALPRHGIRWVDLANLSPGGEVLPAIASACGLRLLSDEPAKEIAATLSGYALLLVLDNCEHVAAEVAPIVSTVLARAPGVNVLATSQAPLLVRGEVQYRLDPLALPPPDAPLDSVSKYSALQLFELRARSIDRRFRIDAGNAAAAADVCRQLDGVPLAIEMAAVWAPMLGPAALAARLGERIRLLARSHRDSSPRHENLRAALDWSHSLLEDPERHVLRRLGVFRGGFSIDLVRGLCCDPGSEEWEVLDSLGTLVDKSLVQVEAGASPRYRLLESTRLYAHEKLSEAGEAEFTVRRHGQVMAELSRDVIRAFREELGASRFLPEYDNLATAFQEARARDDAAVAALTGQALARLDKKRGLHFPMKSRKHAAHALLTGASPEVAARLWNCIALSRHVRGPVAKLAAGRAEIDAWRVVGDGASLYEALGQHAESAASAGAHPEAEEALREAARLEDPAWPPIFRLQRLFFSALAAAFGNDPRELDRRASRMEPLAAEVGAMGTLQMVKLFRAEAALNLDDPEAAIHWIEAEIPSCSPDMLGHSAGTALVCQSLIRLGRDRDAAALVVPALGYAQRNGVGGWFLDCVAVLAARAGRPADAALLLGCADSCYLAVEEVRRLQDRRCETEAAAGADAALGSPQSAALRLEGRRYPHERAQALAVAVAQHRIQHS